MEIKSKFNDFLGRKKSFKFFLSLSEMNALQLLIIFRNASHRAFSENENNKTHWLIELQPSQNLQLQLCVIFKIISMIFYVFHLKSSGLNKIKDIFLTTSARKYKKNLQIKIKFRWNPLNANHNKFHTFACSLFFAFYYIFFHHKTFDSKKNSPPSFRLVYRDDWWLSHFICFPHSLSHVILHTFKICK